MQEKFNWIVRSACILFILLLFSTGESFSYSYYETELLKEQFGHSSFKHLSYISENIGARPTGSDMEKKTRYYIKDTFNSLGFEVKEQSFSFIHKKNTYSSSNIIATKYGESEKTLIVGAHYDSVPAIKCLSPERILTGAGDNASGIGAILEAGERMSNQDSELTIRFIAFGAEEMGLHGSQFYTEQMSKEEINNTIGMINLDSVGIGDFFYVYAGKDNNPGWLRDLSLDIGKRLNYELRTSPESEYYAYGTTGDWSDHTPFRLLGIPIAYFEWANWDIDLNGGVETKEHGWIMHTCKDNLFLVKPDKIKATTHVLTTILLELSSEREEIDEKRTIPSTQSIEVQKRYIADPAE